jgi:hypothetical protein
MPVHRYRNNLVAEESRTDHEYFSELQQHESSSSLWAVCEDARDLGKSIRNGFDLDKYVTALRAK